MDMPVYLLDLSYQELERLVTTWGEPSYRSEQIWQWIYRHLASSPSEMTNLPQELRQQLHNQTQLTRMRPLATQTDENNRTQKVLLEAADGARIETVLMRYRERNTVCLSSQVGCPVGCPFCATGRLGLERNLSAGEIVEQALHFARQLSSQGSRITNVVLMGMGEPLLNFGAVWRAITNLHHPSGMDLGTRRFTISTIGVAPGIRRLAQEPGEVGLAISLHAPDNALRNQLVPLNQRYPIEDVLEATRYYIQETGRRVTFEYALMADINDAPAQAAATAELLRGMLCHVNLIPMNTVPQSDMAPSSATVIARFRDVLCQRGIATTIRKSRGVETGAACGQLSASQPKHPHEKGSCHPCR